MNDHRELHGASPKCRSARVPKLCGGDIELGNFMLDAHHRGGTGNEAARALLREVDGLPRLSRSFTSSYSQPYTYRSPGYGGDASGEDCDGYYGSRGYGGGYWYGYNPQDWGRKFLPANGGCAYIDLEHLEICLPEVIGAHDWVAAWHAMLRIARQALSLANDSLPPNRRINVLVNNSDGQGNAWGSHLDFMVTRQCWDNIFHRKLHHMLYLASYQASSIIFAGQGKVGAENGSPEVDFQLSQRADFFETLTGSQTTANRPVVNSRDESLCGRRPDLARVHCIFYDSNLCHVANLLKVGVMQMVLAMIEAEHINPLLILDDPVGAVLRWSHDPALEARVRTTSGEEMTATELQLRFLEEANRFADSGGFDGIVPCWREIMSLWEDTLAKLQRPDRVALLAPRLDWALKLSILESVLGEDGLDWQSPEIKHLDHMYANLDLDAGIYWAYEHSGFVERIVSDAQIEALRHSPPTNTRAWTRAMLLRMAGADGIDTVDWDSIRVKQREAAYLTTYRRIELLDPLSFGRSEAEHLFAEGRELSEALDELEREAETETPTQPDSGGGGIRALPANASLAAAADAGSPPTGPNEVTTHHVVEGDSDGHAVL